MSSLKHSSHPFDLDRLVDELREARREWREANRRHAEIGTRGFPSRETMEKLMVQLCGALFPIRLGPPDIRIDNEDRHVGAALRSALGSLIDEITLELGYSLDEAEQHDASRRARYIAYEFANALPSLRRLIDTDVSAAYVGDPAARSVDEVLLCYPCIQAIIHHRIAHRLHGLGAPLVARMISEIANSRTGIDIHPGASIGRSFFIDHGTGVVIGETAIIGNNVRLYQAVTLGARSFPADDSGNLKRGVPRHPIVEDGVIIYAGATILGRITIGRGSTIGGNVWLTESIPPGSNVYQAKTQHRIVTRGEPDLTLISGSAA